MKLFISVLLLVFSIPVFSQVDTTAKPAKSRFWTPRYGIGIQHSPFLEIGIARLGSESHRLEFGSWCFYSGAELGYRIQDSKMIPGIKCGFETSWVIFMWALEAKYLSDFNYSQLLITPKIGLSLGGIVNILYGYNIYAGLKGVGNNQISLTVNLNKKTLRKIY